MMVHVDAVRSGLGEEAIKFLRETRRLSRQEAVSIIAEAAKKLRT